MQPAPQIADLLLAYDWPYDEPFVVLLGEVLQSAGLSLLPVSAERLSGTLGDLQAGRRTARAYLDRASDTDLAFRPLDEWALQHVRLHLNPSARRRQIWHKTRLHWEFIQAGIHTPYTIAIPSLERQPALNPPPDFGALGSPFSIKPDLGGGGWGVVLNAQGWEDVQAARIRLPQDDLILQQFIEPRVLHGRRAWFRVMYACGQAFPCWWDDQTRLFGPLITGEQRAALELEALCEIAHSASRISGLQLFSSEVALLPDGRFVVVDYVNDPVDLRFLPHAAEGMPGEVARGVAQAMAAFLTAG